MTASDGSAGVEDLVRQVERRMGLSLGAANVAGAVVVFVLLAFVLPTPPEVAHDTGLFIANAAVFAGLVALDISVVSVLLGRTGRARLTWASSGRHPSERERDLVLRLPLKQQAVIAAVWLLGALVFSVLNAPFSAEFAGNVGVTIVLGGLVTCALGYLVSERLLRPITALALAAGVPGRPQLPGVAARALLSWTLGTGVILLGLALIGLGGLHERRFTAERLSIAIVVLSLVGIVVGLATMVALARSLADPVEALRRAVGVVEQGDLDQEVGVYDGSEVGLLQAGFNRMLAGLRERERLRDLFGRQVGEDVVRHALDRGVQLGGEARDAAVLFVDLAGSTTLAERRDPAEVVSLLNSFFAIVVDVVAANHGWVNKFAGDAALCVFGAPLPDPAAASCALAAARTLCDRVDSELGELRVGIGVSAGRVVAGNIGAASRFEYTVIGDPVNEAARLTELAKSERRGVLASEAALARANAEERERWQVREQITLRGRSAATKLAAPSV